MNLFGTRPSNVLELLRQRRSVNYLPSSNFDEHKIGLVIEGGGIRGVISCAAVDALYQLGYGKCFDRIYGTSAGAINGAYFICGQSAMGTSIYYEDLTGRRFINPFRWPGPMKLDYLFNEWITKGKRLDCSKVIQSNIPLYITTTNYETGETRYFCSNDLNSSTLISALRASAAAPLYSAHKECIDGGLYNDGAVNDAIPIEKALLDGCTHAVCLLTQEYGYKKGRERFESLLEKLILFKYPRAYKDALVRSRRRYNNLIDIVFGGSPVPVLAIVPERSAFMITNSETRARNLIRATKDSLKRTAFILGDDSSNLKLYSNMR